MKFAREPAPFNAVTNVILVILFSCITQGVAADYPTTVRSQEPVGYWRLNETTQPPIPRPPANSGSLGASANGQFLLGASPGQPGALTGSPATSTRFTNPDMDVGYGGSKVEIPFRAA